MTTRMGDMSGVKSPNEALRDNLRPFVCLGVGEYYIQGSKAMIKQGKTDPQERGLDYEHARSV